MSGTSLSHMLFVDCSTEAPKRASFRGNLEETLMRPMQGWMFYVEKLIRNTPGSRIGGSGSGNGYGVPHTPQGLEGGMNVATKMP